MPDKDRWRSVEKIKKNSHFLKKILQRVFFIIGVKKGELAVIEKGKELWY